MTVERWRYDPAQYQRVFVQDAESLCEVAGQLTEADAVGVDLEMVQRVQRKPGGVQDWIHVLALIQISSDTLSAVIDPVRCHDLMPLRPLMAGPIRKVFLGGGQDAALLDKNAIPARTIADVGEVALAIWGRREDGMAAIARRIFDISLDKTVRRADWLARPLNPALLAYAHQDAELTLLIYRWFQQHYPDVLAAHERVLLDPPLPSGTPEWLREAMSRSTVDPLAVVMERGLAPEYHADVLTDEVRAALTASTAPRQVNRLLRVASDLGLDGLLPDVLPLLSSPSSLVRASAARAVGKLADPDTGTANLEAMKGDPIEDVRKAADAGLRDLKNNREAATAPEPEEAAPALSDSALSALQQLLDQLEGGEEG